jgi:hypothetical protein
MPTIKEYLLEIVRPLGVVVFGLWVVLRLPAAVRSVGGRLDDRVADIATHTLKLRALSAVTKILRVTQVRMKRLRWQAREGKLWRRMIETWLKSLRRAVHG